MLDLMNYTISPELLPPPEWAMTFILLALVLRFLKIFSYPEKPQVTVSQKGTSKGDELKNVLSGCPLLDEKYSPPLVWGRCGHLQTAVYGVLGHASLRRTYDRRCFVKLPDGTTVSFDIFEPIKAQCNEQDITLALCPGIANSSESNYIRTCVHYAQENGYRCAILNHLGALATIPLTSQRIFSYGGTEEIEAMMDHLCSLYPNTKFISIGFSMGANITTRYLAKLSKTHKAVPILLGLSVCQGYSATASAGLYHDWENGRRVYNYVITENMKRLLRRNYDMAVAPHSRSGLVNEQRLWAATSLIALDEQYNRRVYGFRSVGEFYDANSCLPEIPDITIPMVFVNAFDDPLIPPCLWEPVKKICEESTRHAFILVKHGGHLGFLEGKSAKPNSVSWLDRFIVQLANASVQVLTN